jgi:hypothetical protein
VAVFIIIIIIILMLHDVAWLCKQLVGRWWRAPAVMDGGGG